MNIQKKILISIFICLIYLIMFLLLFGNNIKKAFNFAIDLNKNKQVLASKQRGLEDLAKNKQMLIQLSDKNDLINKKIINSNDFLNSIMNLNSLIINNNLNSSNINIFNKERDETNNIYIFVINLNASGEYKNVLNFINELSSDEFFYFITGFEILPSINENIVLDATIEITLLQDKKGDNAFIAPDSYDFSNIFYYKGESGDD